MAVCKCARCGKAFGSWTATTTQNGKEMAIHQSVVRNADGVVIEGFTMDGQGHRDAHRGIWCSFSTLTISNNAPLLSLSRHLSIPYGSHLMFRLSHPIDKVPFQPHFEHLKY